MGQEEGITVSHFRRLPPAASRSEDGIGWGRPTGQYAAIVVANPTRLAEKLRLM